MMKLSLLTRNFHDQLCEKVVLDNNILSIYIYAFECGDKYFFDGKCEDRSPNSGLIEIGRSLVIKFYNVRDVNSSFDFNFDDSLDIFELTIINSNVTFTMYYEDGRPNLLSFNADGFDIEYLEE